MKFNAETRVLTVDTRECHMCQNDYHGIGVGRAVGFGSKVCEKCNGTTKRGGGRCRACKVESWEKAKYPAGHVVDHSQPLDAGPCVYCDGTCVVAETLYDYVQEDVMRAILEATPVAVRAADRELSWGEAHLGIMLNSGKMHAQTLGSIVDYGRGWKEASDSLEGFRTRVTEELMVRHVQGVKVANADGLVVDMFAILLARNGYTVVGIHKSTADAS